MEFDKAFTEFLDGRFINRSGWEHGGYLVKIRNMRFEADGFVNNKLARFTYLSEESIFLNIKGRLYYYEPTQNDLLADDWMVYDATKWSPFEHNQY